MASTESTKEHTLFTPFAVTPGQERWQGFEEKRFAHGGRADDHGWSYTDVFRGVDDGGAAPGATALIAANFGSAAHERADACGHHHR